MAVGSSNCSDDVMQAGRESQGFVWGGEDFVVWGQRWAEAGCEAHRERGCGREELRFFADGNGSGGRLEPSAIVDGFQFKIG